MADYERGTMNIAEQSRTFSSFIGMSVWFGGLTILSVLFLSLTFAAHAGWMVSLIITTIVGILMGLALKLKASWYATVIGFAAICFLSAIVAGLVGMML
ncbi:aa3-type cytochrome c oxidase subunit IV [Hyphobacterium sp. HN65]|uniref:Aa3-type cytochrome c oxidase subunit IV n=1 Tax=Hyphobacterium lacteum TaxID=3116575 RepID=A0ABU7LPG1_9PROT|nr:aa3-type cytochrome c oxidase subunit IV [Hyphobacterium sp. HN65]MEE2525800.1 aa3-type cytochrome c oxidase subunit IV [Hyphobacterium sp. HN65]